MDLTVKEFDVNNAEPPRRMTERAAGFDFWAEEIIEEGPRSIWYRTGYGVSIPNGYYGDLRARSSVSETGLILANGAGVIDPDYQGEVQFRFYKVDPDKPVLGGRPNRKVNIYKPGDRIGQMVITPQVTQKFDGVQVVNEFQSETERGEGGFGSTG
jgi:dUTP pyrophosphatase